MIHIKKHKSYKRVEKRKVLGRVPLAVLNEWCRGQIRHGTVEGFCVWKMASGDVCQGRDFPRLRNLSEHIAERTPNGDGNYYLLVDNFCFALSLISSDDLQQLLCNGQARLLAGYPMNNDLSQGSSLSGKMTLFFLVI
ncbi:hypothetical protein TNCV_4427451 [Trichonephila clavipes]|nr:hypothetical protein TNCV_4427451 [Trichonephila clavipes]